MNKKLYYFIVGETSGDQHAALLMKELIGFTPYDTTKWN